MTEMGCCNEMFENDDDGVRFDGDCCFRGIFAADY